MQGTRKQTSRKGSVIYEEVLQKNFEIIETFLKKFHQIFIRQDQFEEHLNKFATKFDEYDQNIEEFRQQQRLSLVMLQKKINNLKVSSRDSHRSSHRWSKGNLPIFQANESAQGGKNYTLLRFNSIEQQPVKQITQKSSVQRKQTLESVSFSTKQYDDIKESIDSMKQEMNQMKDKLKFLSVYTSNLDSHQVTKNKLESMKKQILQILQNDLSKKIQKNIRNQMIETQNVFLQQINNLTIKASGQLTQQISKKTQLFNFQLQKINQNIFTKKQAQKLQYDINKDLKQIADESMKTFAQKQQFRNFINHFNKKIKIIENQNKKSQEKSQKDKQLSQYFTSLLKVNSSNGKATQSLEKMSKSQSQFIKNKSQNFRISSSEEDIKDKDKQNIRKKTQQNSNIDNLSKGSLLTSQVSKDFMKNFGLKQKKLIKGNFISSKKSSFNMTMSQPQFGNKMISRPCTATPQISDSIQQSEQF